MVDQVQRAAPGTSSQATIVSDRTGTQLTVTPVTTVSEIGEFVTDVTLNPFIAPRTISFVAYNMRPSTRLYVFFDNVNVSEFCAPSTRDASNNYTTSTSTSTSYNIPNTADYTGIPRSGDWGSAIYSDSRGIVAGQFNIPEARFRTGERTVTIADVDNLTLGGDAHTTVCSATFTASNLTVLKKTLTLTTITPELSFNEVTDKVVGVAKAQGILDVSVFYEPLAQAMTINTPNNEAGIFATSLDIFFRQKPSPTDTVNNLHPNGVEVYICEILNGYPNGRAVLPFSRVHKNYSEINVSSSGTTATKFTFEAPVFLNNNTEYAFVVKPDNNDPDYQVWTANLGDIDVSTGYQVFSQPVLGTAFYGATLNQWTALPTEYVKFVLRRANFVGTTATAVFENSNMDFLPVSDLQFVNTSVGLREGDIVFEANTPSTNLSAVFLTSPGSGYNANATVTLTFSNSVTNTAYVNSVVSATGRISNLLIQTSLSGITGSNPTLTIAPPSSINITANSTGFSNSSNIILVSSANSRFEVGDRIYYSVPSGNTPIAPLSGNNYYYISFVNSSSIALTGNSGGANIDITDNRTTNPGETHTITGTRATGYVVVAGTPSVGDIKTSVYGTYSYYNRNTGIMNIANSTGNFTNNSFIQVHRFPTTNISNPNSATLIAYANSGVLHDQVVDAWVTQVASIVPPGTDLSFTYKGTSNNYVRDTFDLPTNIGFETEFLDIQRIVASKTNEVNNMSSQKSATLTANLVTDSSFLSPLVDTVKYNQLAIANQIDPIDFSYEEFFNNGGSKSKYISKTITLAEGQDAQDIQVILTAHRPVDTDIQVWVKFQSSADPESIDQKTWTPLINTNYDSYTNPLNINEFKEYVFTMPKFYSMIPTTGTITTSNNSATVIGENTLFGDEVKVGWFINMRANSSVGEYTRKIVDITSNTVLTLDSPFSGNYSANEYYLVVPPTTAWMSRNSATKLTGNVTVSSTNNYVYGYSISVDTTTSVNTGADKITSTNSTFFSVGDLVYYHVPTGNVAIGGLSGNTVYYINAANSSSVKLAATSGGAAIDLTSNGSGTHSLCKTNFTNELRVGNIIYINGDQQQVTGIANASHLTVNSPWSSDGTYPGYIATRTGLSYFNMSASTFTTYKRFQIKVVLQSNVSARVPILNDLRALALQV